MAGPVVRYAPLVAERLVITGGLPRPGSWTRAQRDPQEIDGVEKVRQGAGMVRARRAVEWAIERR